MSIDIILTSLTSLCCNNRSRYHSWDVFWLEHTDGVVQDSSISSALKWRYYSLALSNRYLVQLEIFFITSRYLWFVRLRSSSLIFLKLFSSAMFEYHRLQCCYVFTGEFPSQRPVTRRFDVFFDLRLDKHLRKQSRGWWFETPSRSLWRHCNVTWALRYRLRQFAIFIYQDKHFEWHVQLKSRLSGRKRQWASHCSHAIYRMEKYERYYFTGCLLLHFTF